MSVNTNHPKYKEFILNEIKTLGFIRKQTYLADNFDLVSKAETFFSGFQGIKNRHIGSKDFIFECELEMIVEGKPRRILLGANVRASFSMVSYMLAICESDKDNLNLIRKFHFDYALPRKGESDKPIYHLQYGGEDSNFLVEKEISVDHLYPKVSSPRILCMPINLALVLDMIFCEFSSERTAKIIANPEWKKFIKTNESFILEPFFTRVKEFIGNEHSSSRLLRDFCYGR